MPTCIPLPTLCPPGVLLNGIAGTEWGKHGRSENTPEIWGRGDVKVGWAQRYL